jgi:hypothetical protein
MAYVNGRIPASALAPITAGRLRKNPNAAAAWNAMNARVGGVLRPLGSMSSYRTFAQQVYLYARSRPGWAARPGTSNHGWGLAVDIATRHMRALVDRYGERYGWAKKWSDASWEWWHLKYRPGVWNGKAPVVYPTLRKGTLRRKYIRLVQRILWRNRFRGFKLNGKYDRATRSAVKRFQRKKGLHPDGVVGPRTWRHLLKAR